MIKIVMAEETANNLISNCDKGMSILNELRKESKCTCLLNGV